MSQSRDQMMISESDAELPAEIGRLIQGTAE